MLERRLAEAQRSETWGAPVIEGRLGGQDVVLALTGMSLVNAAMTTQRVIDRYAPTRIVVCGIAGGADPTLAIGEVAIPARWAQPLEATFARELTDGGYGPDILADDWGMANFGALYPHAVEVRTVRGLERKLWFEADPELVAAARALSQAGLRVGGAGVSSSLFVDNAAYAGYLHETFEAVAVDMETAAIAQVAYANGVPFIGVRGITDRAGAEAGANTALLHLDIVAERTAEVVEALLAALD